MTTNEPTSTTPQGGGPAAIGERLRSLASAYNRNQKLGAVAAVAAVVVGIVVMTRFVGGATFSPVFTDLTTEDASAVVEELKSSGTPYQLADGGKSVLVPEDQVHEIRLALSSTALPSSSKVGYGVLDDQGLTTSEFGQRVGFQRAMEGELARTIEAIDVVDTATVHLALPEDSAFALEDQQASASVLVHTRRGAAVDEDQVQAIVNLVASGVKGLDPSDVTVADQDGTVLAAPGQSPGAGAGGGSRQKQTEGFERSVATSIEQMLAAVVGPDAARVTVSADLDFDQTNVSRESFEQPEVAGAPAEVPLEQSTKRETFSGASPAPTGILGADTPPVAGAEGSTYSLDEGDVRFAVNRVVESTNTAPGAINRLSVAVVVDESRVPARLTEQLQALVAAGAGVDEARGDTVALTRMPFDTSIADAARREQRQARQAEEAEVAAQRTQSMALAVFLLLLLVVAFVTYRRAARQRRRRQELLADLRAGMLPAARTAHDGGLDSAPAAVATLDPAEGGAALAAAAAIEDGPAPAPALVGAGAPAELDGALATASLPAAQVLSADDEVRLSRQAQLADLVEQQPDEVAQLMRSWLGDRRGGRR